MVVSGIRVASIASKSGAIGQGGKIAPTRAGGERRKDETSNDGDDGRPLAAPGTGTIVDRSV